MLMLMVWEDLIEHNHYFYHHQSLSTWANAIMLMLKVSEDFREIQWDRSNCIRPEENDMDLFQDYNINTGGLSISSWQY